MGFMYVSLLCLFSIVLCSPHNQKQKDGSLEKVEERTFTNRDADHYKDGKHNRGFDYEAVLGSHDAATEFDNLPPKEAKRRLLHLAAKMDANKDDYVDKKELTNWVLRSFKMLTQEEALDEFEDEDANEDDEVTWEEHASETYGIHDDDGSQIKNVPEESQMYEHDKELFKAADLNGDGTLDKDEFPGFSHPEEFEHMHETVYKLAMKKRDKDNDGYLDFTEFIEENYGENQITTEHFLTEKDRFDNELDIDGDSLLNREEVMSWLIPNNLETAETEADHLIQSSDTDKDGKLTFDEIVQHYSVFVGSEATDFGEQIHNFHQFSDEL